MKSSIITAPIKTALISFDAVFGKTNEKLSASDTSDFAQPAVFYYKRV